MNRKEILSSHYSDLLAGAPDWAIEQVVEDVLKAEAAEGVERGLALEWYKKATEAEKEAARLRAANCTLVGFDLTDCTLTVQMNGPITDCVWWLGQRAALAGQARNDGGCTPIVPTQGKIRLVMPKSQPLNEFAVPRKEDIQTLNNPLWNNAIDKANHARRA